MTWLIIKRPQSENFLQPLDTIFVQNQITNLQIHISNKMAELEPFS